MSRLVMAKNKKSKRDDGYDGYFCCCFHFFLSDFSRRYRVERIHEGEDERR